MRPNTVVDCTLLRLLIRRASIKGTPKMASMKPTKVYCHTAASPPRGLVNTILCSNAKPAGDPFDRLCFEVRGSALYVGMLFRM